MEKWRSGVRSSELREKGKGKREKGKGKGERGKEQVKCVINFV
jgi:hypothetical protein